MTPIKKNGSRYKFSQMVNNSCSRRVYSSRFLQDTQHAFKVRVSRSVPLVIFHATCCDTSCHCSTGRSPVFIKYKPVHHYTAVNCLNLYLILIRFLVFNATFSNISAIAWRPVLLVEEAGGNHRPWASN